MIYDSQTSKLLVDFNTYTQNGHRNQNNVASEPLENGTYSNDSKQNTPTFVSITALKSIKNNSINNVLETKEILKKLNTSPKLINILLNPMKRIYDETNNGLWWMYGTIYKNYTLFDFSFDQTPNKLNYEFKLIFQEVRMTGIQYGTTQIMANTDNTAVINNGQVQPKSDKSILSTIHLNNFFDC